MYIKYKKDYYICKESKLNIISVEFNAFLFDSIILENKIYVFGGLNSIKTLDFSKSYFSRFVFSMKIDNISEVNPKFKVEIFDRYNKGKLLPPNRFGHTLTYNKLINKAVLIGGCNFSKIFDDIWVLDLSNEEWVKIKMKNKNSLTCLFLHAAEFLFNSTELFIIGGFSNNKIYDGKFSKVGNEISFNNYEYKLNFSNNDLLNIEKEKIEISPRILPKLIPINDKLFFIITGILIPFDYIKIISSEIKLIDQYKIDSYEQLEFNTENKIINCNIDDVLKSVIYDIIFDITMLSSKIRFKRFQKENNCKFISINDSVNLIYNNKNKSFIEKGFINKLGSFCICDENFIILDGGLDLNWSSSPLNNLNHVKNYNFFEEQKDILNNVKDENLLISSDESNYLKLTLKNEENLKYIKISIENILSKYRMNINKIPLLEITNIENKENFIQIESLRTSTFLSPDYNNKKLIEGNLSSPNEFLQKYMKKNDKDSKIENAIFSQLKINDSNYFKKSPKEERNDFVIKKHKIDSCIKLSNYSYLAIKNDLIKVKTFNNIENNSLDMIHINESSDYFNNKFYNHFIDKLLINYSELKEMYTKNKVKIANYNDIKSNLPKFPFKSEHIIALAIACRNLVKTQPNVLKLTTPIKIFGDIHGQFDDLIRFFNKWNYPHEYKNGDIEYCDYLFLGDYVDRGSFSLEVICLLMSLKLKYPEKIWILRGNHEDRSININFGFYEECRSRLEKDSFTDVYESINDFFDYLPLCATIDNDILCLHGGLGQNLSNLESIENIKRPLIVKHEASTKEEQIVMDILWSDPTEQDSINGIQPNLSRDGSQYGNIVRFGPDIVEKFLESNNLSMIIRAHECVMDGFERFCKGKLITLFSATDYCRQFKNAGGMLLINNKLTIIPHIIYPIYDEFNLNWIENKEDYFKRPPTPIRSKD